MTNIILFRAQPFHNGHLQMIKKAYEDSKRENNKLYIFVGSADKSGTKRNPLPIGLRLNLIRESLKEIFEEDDSIFNPILNVIPLDDLSDEANNSVDWGYYLYSNITKIVKDEYITFYYSDKPSIILSWFNGHLREKINFKFLPRYEEYSATLVREYLVSNLDDALYSILPKYVYDHKEEIRRCIMEAK